MIARVLIAFVRLYQLTLSRLIRATLGNICRFEPSCSRYAVACLEGHGALRGSLLSLKRLCRCQPFHPGGHDPPPPPRLRSRVPASFSSSSPAPSSTSPSSLATLVAPADPRPSPGVKAWGAEPPPDRVRVSSPGAGPNGPPESPEGSHGTR